jgi:predicted nucleotidyltransferase
LRRKKGLLTLCKKVQTLEEHYNPTSEGKFMRAREGDLIQTGNNVIFDVKGLVHPPNKILAFPRYIPSPTGNRTSSQGNLYGKVYNLAERYQYLKQKTPHLLVFDPVFGENLCEVPTTEITKHYNPIEALAKLRQASKLQPLEQKAVALAEELQEAAGIPWSSIGISGSVMAGLFTLQSDIDPLVYGTENSRKAYEAMERLQKTQTSHFKAYTRSELQALFEFRSKDTKMSFEDFERVETRKFFQGMYDGTDYFVRFVKDWQEVDEQYGDVCYENSGYAKVSALVVDDSEALFTPCSYKLEKVKILEGPQLEPLTEVASFRGRFCMQAKPGEAVVAQGKVERVTDKRSGNSHYRVIIGNQPADYLTLSHA